MAGEKGGSSDSRERDVEGYLPPSSSKYTAEDVSLRLYLRCALIQFLLGMLIWILGTIGIVYHLYACRYKSSMWCGGLFAIIGLIGYGMKCCYTRAYLQWFVVLDAFVTLLSIAFFVLSILDHCNRTPRFSAVWFIVVMCISSIFMVWTGVLVVKRGYREVFSRD